MLPVSLFWLAWTTDKGVSYWSGIVAYAGFHSLLSNATLTLDCGSHTVFGFSQLVLFVSTYAYLIQTYGL